MDFAEYNADTTRVVEEILKPTAVSGGGYSNRTVPYKENRAVLFDSALFHHTDEFRSGAIGSACAQFNDSVFRAIHPPSAFADSRVTTSLSFASGYTKRRINLTILYGEMQLGGGGGSSAAREL